MKKLITELNKKGYKALAHRVEATYQVKAAKLYSRLQKYDLENMSRDEVDEFISDYLLKLLKDPLADLYSELKDLLESFDRLKKDKVKFKADSLKYVEKAKNDISILWGQLIDLMKKY